jgi:hypothetical protein
MKSIVLEFKCTRDSVSRREGGDSVHGVALECAGKNERGELRLKVVGDALGLEIGKAYKVTIAEA